MPFAIEVFQNRELAPGQGAVEAILTITAGDDQRIVNWLADEFKRDQGVDLRDDRMALQRLKEASERAKIELSTTMQTEINLPFITADASGPKHLTVNLTRSKLEQLVGDAPFADASLHIWTPVSAHDLVLRQVHPTVDDRSATATELSAQVRAFLIGAWSPGESRDYYLAIQVQPADVDDEMLAARASVAYQGRDKHDHEDRPSHGRVFAHWTSDPSLPAARDPHVAHYATEVAIADAIQHGLRKRDEGDETGATQFLGHAVKLAHESGDVETSARLQKVVDVEDPAGGTVALKRHVDPAAQAELEAGGTRRVARRSSTPEEPAT